MSAKFNGYKRRGWAYWPLLFSLLGNVFSCGGVDVVKQEILHFRLILWLSIISGWAIRLLGSFYPGPVRFIKDVQYLLITAVFFSRSWNLSWKYHSFTMLLHDKNWRCGAGTPSAAPLILKDWWDLFFFHLNISQFPIFQIMNSWLYCTWGMGWRIYITLFWGPF